MKQNWMHALFALLVFAGPAPGAAPLVEAEPLATLQDGAKKEEPPLPIEIVPVPAADDPHEEIERLFGEVERRMRKVNRLLEDASAGKHAPGAAAKELDGAIRAIDELLKDTQASSRAAVEGIDKILELADHPHSGGT